MLKSLVLLLVLLIMPIHRAFAEQPSIPSISADQSHVADPPKPIEPDMKGFGTRAVPGRTLNEMLEHCRAQRVSQDAVEQARCKQLLRTLKNQPGNTRD